MKKSPSSCRVHVSPRSWESSAELQKQEWKVYINSMQNVDFDLCRSTWVGDYADANTFLGMFNTNDGNNDTGWSNATYDKLMADARREPDTAKRADIFRRAETILGSR